MEPAAAPRPVSSSSGLVRTGDRGSRDPRAAANFQRAMAEQGGGDGAVDRDGDGNADGNGNGKTARDGRPAPSPTLAAAAAARARQVLRTQSTRDPGTGHVDVIA